MANLFYDNDFYTPLFFNCSALFFVNEFFWKAQNLSESIAKNIYTIEFLEILCDLFIRWVFIMKWEQNCKATST